MQILFVLLLYAHLETKTQLKTKHILLAVVAVGMQESGRAGKRGCLRGHGEISILSLISPICTAKSFPSRAHCFICCVNGWGELAQIQPVFHNE